jgi:hypothetical protein
MNGWARHCPLFYMVLTQLMKTWFVRTYAID